MLGRSLTEAEQEVKRASRFLSGFLGVKRTCAKTPMLRSERASLEVWLKAQDGGRAVSEVWNREPLSREAAEG